jgi:hypothetical protein
MRSGNSIRLKSELLDFIVTDALSISFKIWNGSLLFGTRVLLQTSTSFLIYKPCQKIIQLSCIVLPLNIIIPLRVRVSSCHKTLLRF